VAERSLTGVVLVYDSFTSRSRTQRVKNPTRTCGAKSFDTVIDDRLAGDVDGADRPFPQLLGGLPGFQAVKPARTPRARPWRSTMVARRTPSIGAMGAGGKGHKTPPGSSPPATLRGKVGLQVDDHLSKRLLDQVGGHPRD
jgi:hypothetical protein